jgi:hypothetical protein
MLSTAITGPDKALDNRNKKQTSSRINANAIQSMQITMHQCYSDASSVPKKELTLLISVILQNS